MYRGLGDDTTESSGGYVAPNVGALASSVTADLSTALAAVQTGSINWGALDWHEWALIVLGGYVVIRGLTRSVRSTGRAVKTSAKKTASGFHKRRRALKTVFTGK
jgi:hypothetical protein